MHDSYQLKNCIIIALIQHFFILSIFFYYPPFFALCVFSMFFFILLWTQNIQCHCSRITKIVAMKETFLILTNNLYNSLFFFNFILLQFFSFSLPRLSSYSSSVHRSSHHHHHHWINFFMVWDEAQKLLVFWVERKSFLFHTQ
jgi:hypothetical protein